MKYIKNSDGTVVLDGSPEDIAAYHHRMATKSFPERTKRTIGTQVPGTPARRIIKGKTRASYSSAERKAIRELANTGKSAKQIARRLWAKELSPIRRTPMAIYTELSRMLRDPNRR